MDAFTILSSYQDVICGRHRKLNYSRREVLWTLWHTNQVYRQRGQCDGGDLWAPESRSHHSWFKLVSPLSLIRRFLWLTSHNQKQSPLILLIVIFWRHYNKEFLFSNLPGLEVIYGGTCSWMCGSDWSFPHPGLLFALKKAKDHWKFHIFSNKCLLNATSPCNIL